MSVLDRLTRAPGVYWGEGRGPDGARFLARVSLVPDRQTLTLDYEAWSPERGLQHAETARLARTGQEVVLAATSNGGDDTMLFREGDAGVFGSVGEQRVGLVITARAKELTFAWWWTGKDGQLREQSRAVVNPVRQVVDPPAVPGVQLVDVRTEQMVPAGAEARAGSNGAGRRRRVEPAAGGDLQVIASPAGPGVGGEADGRADGVDDALHSAHQGTPDGGSVPWPGILVLHGPSTGIVAQRLAARLTRAAVVRTDLFDRAVRGTAGRPDPALRQRIALSVVQGYASTGHPVILHGASSRAEHEQLVDAIARTGLSPVQLVDVADGEDYGEVARRLIEDD